MGNLERFIPEESETVKRIYAFHEAMENGKPLRKGRMGASVMGKPCERFLWYYFRKLFVKTFSGRMLRLFETGHLEEPRMIRELRGIGCTVHDKDESTGGQFEFTALGGHVVAYPDAVVLGVPEAPKTWHIGEFKTMGGTETQKSKDFEKVQKEGVKVAKPEHHGQMQICMGLGKLTRAIYLTKKKATDELYSERIKYDPVDFKRIMDRAERVIRSSHPAERCATRPDSFSCKFCDAFELCWGTGMSAVPLPRKTCRSCCHATPQIDEGETWARWSCEKHGRDLSPEDQRNACTDHLLLPGLVTFAEATDAGDNWIEFTNHADKAVWVHGAGQEGTWSTDELMRTPGPLVGEKAVAAVKETFGGNVVEAGPSLIEQYSPPECYLLWEGEPTGEGLIVAFQVVRDALGLDGGDELTPSAETDNAEHEAVEFGRQALYVNYKGSNYAAVWGRLPF